MGEKARKIKVNLVLLLFSLLVKLVIYVDVPNLVNHVNCLCCIVVCCYSW